MPLFLFLAGPADRLPTNATPLFKLYLNLPGVERLMAVCTEQTAFVEFPLHFVHELFVLFQQFGNEHILLFRIYVVKLQSRPIAIIAAQRTSAAQQIDQLLLGQSANEYCKISNIWYHISMVSDFEWNEQRNRENQEKHGVGFAEAQRAFQDPHRLIIRDSLHSDDEERWFCVGDIGTGIVTARFTMRSTKVRIFGAGYWRKMRKLYYRQKGQS